MSSLTIDIKRVWDYLCGREPALPTTVKTSCTSFYGAGSCVVDSSVLESQIKQLKFLLACGLRGIDAPPKHDARTVFQNSRSPFAYIHPKTMAQYSNPMDKVPHGMVVTHGSPTKWVLTSLMPEGRVIYSPLPIPGLEKILGR